MHSERENGVILEDTKDSIMLSKSSPLARGKRLKSLRMMADLSRKAMEKKYSISAGTLQCWEDGRYGGLTEKGAKRFVTALTQEGIECTVEWLLHGVGVGPQATDKLYLGAAGVHGNDNFEINPNVDSDEASIVQELLTFRRVNQNAIDIKVLDDGMEPDYLQGDYVGGKRRYGDDITSLLGSPCIVETTKGDVLLRCVRSGNQKNHYTLVCTNPLSTVTELITYNVQLVSAAPVIWHRTKDKFDRTNSNS